MFLFHHQHLFAFVISCAIFIITLLLAVKRWINFPIAGILIFLSLAIGFYLNFHNQWHLLYESDSHKNVEKTDHFQNEVLSAIEDLKKEVTIEKENINRITKEISEVFISMEAQTQKIQTFIDEVKHQLDLTKIKENSKQEKPQEN